MKCDEKDEVRHGDAVLVRNSRNDQWVLRTADKIDGSWVNERRLATAEGECWKQWMPYAGNERFEGTSLPKDAAWMAGDICAYENEQGRIRIGFFFGFDMKQNAGNGNDALVSNVPIAWAGIGGTDMSGLDLECIPLDALKRPEKLWPWWKPALYAEQPDPNPLGSRIVPV